ncbi:MAG: T9SS type A sorting domain-containing protein [Flavobacteriales bacterium]|nr:T9SS type A sorting domain-containing protein [Flavobacteriales bacterium]
MRCITLPAFIIASVVNAQITEVATLPGRMETVRSLEDAGVKFISRTSTGFDLLNTDLSPFLSATYPPLPANCNYLSSPLPTYITESLFDEDPSSIEYMLLYQCEIGGTITNSTIVARMDGSVLLQVDGFGPGGVNGLDLFSSSPSIIQTPLGARLLVNQGINTATRIYALPGDLPCISCFDNMEMGNGPTALPSSPSFALFPNPANDQVTISASQAHTGLLISVFDPAGKLVLNVGQLFGDRPSFSVSMLARGFYEVLVQDSSGAFITVLPLIKE